MTGNHQIGKPPEFKGKIWRRGRDSNPRYPKGKRDFELSNDRNPELNEARKSKQAEGVIPSRLFCFCRLLPA